VRVTAILAKNGEPVEYWPAAVHHRIAAMIEKVVIANRGEIA